MDKNKKEVDNADKKLHISDVLCSKKFSVNDVLSNFEEYATAKGFNWT